MPTYLPPAPVGNPIDGFAWQEWFNQVTRILSNVGVADVLLGLSSTGIVTRTATDTYTVRTLTAPAAGITVSNGNGVSGNPTLALANDLLALEGLGSTGLAARTAADTWAQRTITGTANQIAVSNGGGVAGNPTLTLSVGDVLTGKYTPTLANVTNLDASTAYECQYIRVGSMVIVSGKADVDPTAAGQTRLGIPLPVASNIGATEDLAGTAFCPTIAGQGAAIGGDAANNRAIMEWIAVDVTNQSMFFTFMYEVI